MRTRDRALESTGISVKRDAIFYQIFQRFPELFFELIEQTPDRVQQYRFESVEVKEPNFRIDGVFLPPEDASPKVIFFAEVQFQKDQALYHRFFAEIFLYLYRNSTRFDNWYGVLIFPRRGLEPDASMMHDALLNSPQVQCLYLDEVETRSLGFEIIRLLVEPEAQTIEQAKRLINRARAESLGNLSPNDIIEVIATITVYKFSNISRAEVEAMLGLTIQETRVYQEAKEEGRQEGRQEGQREILAATLPLLLQTGLTLEQIAEQLHVDLSILREAVELPQPNSEAP